jgi:hypothetical protein
MPFEVGNLPEAIRHAKKPLRQDLPAYASVFTEIESEMRRKVDEIVKAREAGEPVIPIVQYSDIAAGTVSEQMKAKIKDRGACVIRNTFSSEQARAWDDEIGRYVEENHLNEKLAHAAEDKYFGTLAAAKPQIYGIYWSRPQVQAHKQNRSRACVCFSTACGWPKAKDAVTSIPTKRPSMRTAFAAAHQDLPRSAFRPT